ncbi:MAG: hypothetical protein Q9209_005368 [Squamulea sp. 1 TL-2023]
MDRETAKCLAGLINTEQMDIMTFEATAGDPVDNGKRFTIQEIQARRQAMQNQARESFMLQLAQDDPGSSQAKEEAPPVEPTESPYGSRAGQPTEVMKRGAAVAADFENHSVIQFSEMDQPVEFENKSQVHTAAIMNTPPHPVVDKEQVLGASNSPRSDEKSHTNEVPGRQPACDTTSFSVESSHQIEESSISDSDQITSVHDGSHLEDQSAKTPQASHVVISDTSSPSTPTQTNLNSWSAPAPAQPKMKSRGLWQNIKWAYLTHTSADVELQSKGIWLFEKPPIRTTEQSSDDISRLQLELGLPVVIPSDFEDRNGPSLEYNDIAVAVFTQLPPWKGDDRSIENHAGLVPDFQSEVPLAEYQTVEALGSHVWRHDRDLLTCRGPNCKKMLSDIATTTHICLGCGPKSIIRFCSIKCHIASLSSHAVECWSSRLLINKLIDENTAPPRFSHFAPSIRDRQGYRTYQNYRQRVAAQYAGGRYSMFNPVTEEGTILIWDKRLARHRGPEVPYGGYAREMESRIERCLNIALFDHANRAVVEHLYRLLQLCLRVKNAWNPALGAVLTRQFLFEFNYDANSSLRIRANEPFCECEWLGGAVQLHQATCQSRYRGQGELIQGQRSIRDVVEAMENKHWILRAWRRQHPTEAAWTHRIMGAGFPGAIVEEGWMPKLGKGWVGFNGDEDDVVS